MLERGYPQEPLQRDEEGFYFDSLNVYSKYINGIDEIKEIYLK